MEDAENSRVSIPAKYQLARWILTEKAYNQGIAPYQDFSLLIDLRNSIVHLKEWPRVMTTLESKNLFARDEQLDLQKQVYGGWVSVIETKEMAVWAFLSARGFIADFLDSVKDPSVRELMPAKDDFFPGLLGERV